MIVGRGKTPSLDTLDALTDLKEASFEVRLTGSRFFNTATEYSDWDFFVDGDEPGLEPWLADRGWEELDRSRGLHHFPQYAGDPNIAQVYEKGEVQLQLVRDFLVKVRAQEILTNDPGFIGLCRTVAYVGPSRGLLKHRSRGYWQKAMKRASEEIYGPSEDTEISS